MIAGAVGCWTVSRHRAATRPARPRHGTGACAVGALGARLGVGRRRERGVRGRGARPGRVAGMWAVHLVHSACF